MMRSMRTWKRSLLTLAVGGWTLLSVSCNPGWLDAVIDIEDDWFEDIEFFDDDCRRCDADFWWDGWGLEIYYDD